MPHVTSDSCGQAITRCSPLFAEHPLRRPPPLLCLSLGLGLASDLDLGRQRLRPGGELPVLRLRGQSGGHQGGRGQTGVRPVLGRRLVRMVTSAINYIWTSSSRWGGLDRLLK